MKSVTVPMYNPTFPSRPGCITELPEGWGKQVVDVEADRSQTKRVSECALQSYNKKHNSNYELVEGLCSNGFFENVAWYHANFKAKDRSVLGEDSPTKLFFAELKSDERSSSGLDVKVCRILDGDKQIDNCHQCQIHPLEKDYAKQVLHPTDVFQKGRLVRDMDRVRSLGKRSRDA